MYLNAADFNEILKCTLDSYAGLYSEFFQNLLSCFYFILVNVLLFQKIDEQYIIKLLKYIFYRNFKFLLMILQFLIL